MDAKEDHLEHFQVGHLPTLYYLPDFITQAEESMLLNNIYQAPISKWKSLTNRRLQNWGGVVHEKGLLPQELPSWLTTITDKIYEVSKLFPAPINHVLINEYLPHQGIMPHQDGPAYLPVVAIISLGSPVVMDFTPHSRLRLCGSNQTKYFAEENSIEEDNKALKTHHPFSIILRPRSLLIFKDEAYSEYLHGIKDGDTQHYDRAVNEIEALNHSIVDSRLLGSNVDVEAKGSEDLKKSVVTCPQAHSTMFREVRGAFRCAQATSQQSKIAAAEPEKLLLCFDLVALFRFSLDPSSEKKDLYSIRWRRRRITVPIYTNITI